MQDNNEIISANQNNPDFESPVNNNETLNQGQTISNDLADLPTGTPKFVSTNTNSTKLILVGVILSVVSIILLFYKMFIS